MSTTLIIIGAAAALVVLFIASGRRKNRLHEPPVQSTVESLEAVCQSLLKELQECSNSAARAEVTSRMYQHLDGIRMALDFLSADGEGRRYSLVGLSQAERAVKSAAMDQMCLRLKTCRETLCRNLQTSL
ncbi:MAG: hypothetical protein JSS83_27705 [Cyanobacteria bacterium SZAS LIN-3]|nr:hypothetical protein [Cyanobacteria bacterium SZAS LIN-3]